MKRLGLNLGLNFAVHGDTSCYGNNQLSFLSIKSNTSLCVVVFYCGGDLVTARNLNHHSKALESQALSRAYFLWVPIWVPIRWYGVTRCDVPIGYENVLRTCFLIPS